MLQMGKHIVNLFLKEMYPIATLSKAGLVSPSIYDSMYANVMVLCK